VDDSNGLAFVAEVNSDEHTQWCHQVFETKHCINLDGESTLANSTGVIGSVFDMARKHTVFSVMVCRSGLGFEELYIEAALFEMPSWGGHLWFNVSDLHTKLKLKLCPGTPCGWFDKRFKPWQHLIEQFQLGQNAVRRTIPYARKDDAYGTAVRPPSDAVRCLTFPSVNTAILLLTSCRAVNGTDKNAGLVEDVDARGSFQRIFSGLMLLLPKNLEFVWHFDIGVLRIGDKFVGDLPYVVKVVDGVVELDDFIPWIATVLARHTRQKKALRKEFEEFAEFHGKDFDGVFISLCNLASKKTGRMATALFAQLIWRCSCIIERKVAQHGVVRDVRGAVRRLKREGTPIEAEHITVCNIYIYIYIYIFSNELTSHRTRTR